MSKASFWGEGGADHSKYSAVVPDSVGLNGFRARVLCLTSPGVVSSKIKGFNGSVQWVGLTCNTTYELTGGGPFIHRRVLFKSSIPWASSIIGDSPNNNSGGPNVDEYIRPVAVDLSNSKLVRCLRQLFTQDTVRGVLQGPTSDVGITVLKNEKIELRGHDDGVRLSLIHI